MTSKEFEGQLMLVYIYIYIWRKRLYIFDIEEYVRKCLSNIDYVGLCCTKHEGELRLYVISCQMPLLTLEI